MGMADKEQLGKRTAPDGTVYEILEDGSIRRNIQPGESLSYEIRRINGEIFVICLEKENGKEFIKIAQITSEGDLIPYNNTRVVGWYRGSQSAVNKDAGTKNVVKTVMIVLIFSLLAFFAGIYLVKSDEIQRKDAAAAEAETKKVEEDQKAKEAEARGVEEAKAKKAAQIATRSGGGTKIDNLYWSKRSRNTMT